MSNTWKTAILVALGIAVLGVLYLRQVPRAATDPEPDGRPEASMVTPVTPESAPLEPGESVPNTPPGEAVAEGPRSGSAPEAAPTKPHANPEVSVMAVPRLVSLGAGKCIPCKAMEPVRAELRKEYAGKMIVDFYDVWENPAVGREYGIRGIPTLIFYDASGTELGRTEGYMAKNDILATWKRLGVDFKASA